MNDKERVYVHRLMQSEPKYKWFGRKIRDFIKNYVAIPEIPSEGKVSFEIYDHLGNKYIAKLDNQGRIWCKEWYKKYSVKEGQEIIVKIEDGKILIYPNIIESDNKSELPQSVPIIDKLRKSQRHIGDPTKFEKTLEEAFGLLGFSAKHISGRDEPDILIEESEFKIIIDAKTTKEGIIQSETAIGFERLIRYKERYKAQYVGVVGPGFSEGYIRDTAKKRSVVLIETEAICKLLQNHATYPYDKNDIIDMIFNSGKYVITPRDILPSTINQKKLIETTAAILKVLKNFEKSNITSFTSEHLRIALVGQGISCEINDIEKSLKFLSDVPFQILKKQVSEYVLPDDMNTILKKICLLANIFNKMGGRI